MARKRTNRLTASCAIAACTTIWTSCAVTLLSKPYRKGIRTCSSNFLTLVSHGKGIVAPLTGRAQQCRRDCRVSRVTRAIVQETIAAASFPTVTPKPPVLNYYGVNSFGVEIGGLRVLVDPLLTGDLVFFGQTWAFRGRRRAAAETAADMLRPEAVAANYDVVVLTQALDDHAHRPTLQRIDHRMPVVASPRAARVAKNLGFRNVTALHPGEAMHLGAHLRMTAVPGSVVGPPWEEPENGYVFSDTRSGGLSLGAEPHGNFLGPALGTSLRQLPKAPRVRVDALLVPLTAQRLGAYQLVNGAQEAADTLESLQPIPRFVVPLRNGEIDAQGTLALGLNEQGSLEEFQDLLRQRSKLQGVKVIDMVPGKPVSIE